MTEEWRSIEGLKGGYEVSSTGNVRSTDRVVVASNGEARRLTGRVLGTTVHNGYRKAFIGGKGIFVHRLVAMAFIGKPDGRKFVNHINSVRDDNRVENLEWVTAKENEAHKIRMGNKPSGNLVSGSKLDWAKVLAIITLKGIDGFTHIGISRHYGVSHSTVRRIQNGRDWSHISRSAI